MNDRIYGYNDTLMLLSCDYVVDRCIEHEDVLSARRPQWKAPYFTTLKGNINKALVENIGSVDLANLKAATATVTGTISLAYRGIMDLKQEVEVDFRKNTVRRDYLLSILGFDTLNTKNLSQRVMVEALLTIHKNLNDPIKQELVAAGANPAAIDELKAYAMKVVEANAIQESLKVGRKDNGKANVEVLNEVYDEVISICKLASTYFLGNKDLEDKFNFLTALKANGYTPPPRKKTTESGK